MCEIITLQKRRDIMQELLSSYRVRESTSDKERLTEIVAKIKTLEWVLEDVIPKKSK